jgi:hypothetical protein
MYVYRKSHRTTCQETHISIYTYTYTHLHMRNFRFGSRIEKPQSTYYHTWVCILTRRAKGFAGGKRKRETQTWTMHG